MTDSPLTWHYGLMAERWAEFITETPQLDFFRGEIARIGQPVLDLAFGAGRLLLPLLREGIDIDGCDLSADMLAQCRALAAKEGLSPNLYAQPMRSFSLPRKYRTIYICDSFGIGGSRQDDLEALRRCHAHLEEGGALLVNIDAEYANAEGWKEWLKEYRDNLPEPWPEVSDRQVASDGSEHAAQFRMLELNPLEQLFVRQVRLQKWVKGELVATQEYSLRGNVYLKPEFTLMLQVAGFRQITVRGDYTQDPATSDHRELVFTAVR